MSAPAPVIAIDGPAASGKGAVAQRVAQSLGFHYLDSGALYRLVGFAAQQDGTPLDDPVRVGAIARALPVEFRQRQILLNGVRVEESIREEHVSVAASQVAIHAEVRSALFDRQRAFRRAPGLVAEGRDMGTVIFPDARLKVFLTASTEARAERRYKQLMEKGLSANIQTLLREIQERDARDSSRASAPLKPAVDAVLLDTTKQTIEQVVGRVLVLWRDLK